MSNIVKLRALNNDIVFQFEDEAAKLDDGKKTASGFKEKTTWGFVYSSSKESASNSRWGIVVAVGPDVNADIFPGRRVLIEPLKWTEGIRFQGSLYWKTNDEWVLAVDESQDR